MAGNHTKYNDMPMTNRFKHHDKIWNGLNGKMKEPQIRNKMGIWNDVQK